MNMFEFVSPYIVCITASLNLVTRPQNVACRCTSKLCCCTSHKIEAWFMNFEDENKYCPS